MPEEEAHHQVVHRQQREGADQSAGERIVVADDGVLHGVRKRQQHHQVERVELRQFALAEDRAAPPPGRRTPCTGRRIFSSNGAPTAKMSPHILGETSHSGIPDILLAIDPASPTASEILIKQEEWPDVWAGRGTWQKPVEEPVTDCANRRPHQLHAKARCSVHRQYRLRRFSRCTLLTAQLV